MSEKKKKRSLTKEEERNPLCENEEANTAKDIVRSN